MLDVVVTCQPVTSHDAEPLPVTPPGHCSRCGARLSRYRASSDTLCAPCTAAVGEPVALVDRLQRGEVPERIMLALAVKPLTAHQLSVATDVGRPSIKHALRQLVEQGRIERDGPYTRPVYRLLRDE